VGIGRLHIAIKEEVDSIDVFGSAHQKGASDAKKLELANALIYSSATRQQVELPLDSQAYAVLIDRLQVVP